LSTHQQAPGGEPHARPGGAGAEPSEEQLRAAYEAELSRITATDMIAQATVSLLNIGARRLAPAPSAASEGAPAPGATGGERDLEQARDAIDAVRALLEILERRIPQELRPLRDALSQLQMTYAREIAAAPAPAAQPQGTGAGEPPAGQPPAQAGQPSAAGEQPPAGGQPAPEEGPSRRPGPAEASGRLWVPGR